LTHIELANKGWGERVFGQAGNAMRCGKLSDRLSHCMRDLVLKRRDDPSSPFSLSFPIYSLRRSPRRRVIISSATICATMSFGSSAN
jgi:hypothetical protein